MLPAVTEPVVLLLPPPHDGLQDGLVLEQEPITRAGGAEMVSEHVTELHLSLAVKVYVPGARPETLAVVPTVTPEAFFQT
jgi:hypothetical protein